MILPTPGPDPASRLFGYATPPDGAGPLGPDQLWPTPIHPSREEVMHGLNPLQHLPGIGMIYRAATGETIPAPMRVFGALLVGGPLAALGAGIMGIVEAILTMPPDLSRPSAPAGMTATGSEAGVEPVTPGTLQDKQYTTLATSIPEWMDGPATVWAQSGGAYAGKVLEAGAPVEGTRGQAAYAQASLEWRRSEAMEKGLA